MSRPSLLDESWLNIFAFLDLRSLSRCAAVCTHWRQLAREDEFLWKPLCAQLWRDKQVAPLERWVRPLPSPPADDAADEGAGKDAAADIGAFSAAGSASRAGAAPRGAGGSPSAERGAERPRSPPAARVARREEAALRADAARLTAEIEALQHSAVLQPHDAGGAALGDPEAGAVGCGGGGGGIGGVLLFPTAELFHRFHALVLQLQQCRLELAFAMSRAIRACQLAAIRTSHPPWSSSAHMPRPFSRAMSITLRAAAGDAAEGSAPAADAANASAVPAPPLFELLSWRESLHASIRDSERTCVTLDDLEGECLIDFDGRLEGARVSAGQFVDNRAFRNSAGRIFVEGAHLVLIDIAQSARVTRTTDWGWLCTMDSSRVRWWTVDPTAPPYCGPLRRRMPHSQWEEERLQRIERGDHDWAEGWEQMPVEYAAPAAVAADARTAEGSMAALALGGAANAAPSPRGAHSAREHAGTGAGPAEVAGGEEADSPWMWQVIRPLETSLRLTHLAQTHRPPPPGSVVERPTAKVEY